MKKIKRKGGRKEDRRKKDAVREKQKRHIEGKQSSL